MKTGKEGKKGKKGMKKMPLAEFLGNTAVPDGFDKKVVNWADVTEDDDMSDIPLPKFKEELILPTAPKASRPNEIDTSRVPTMPPFKAYIGNIPYGAGEEELKQFFENLSPISVQLPRDDKGTGRTRGFGYVEFETRECLIEALKMHGTQLNERTLKVSLPEEGQRDQDRGRDRGSGAIGDDDRTAGDWRKAPRPEQQMSASHQPQYQQQQSQYSSAPRPDTSREMAGPWRSAAASVPSEMSRTQRNGYDNPPLRNYEPAGGAFRESRPGYDSSYSDDRRPPGGAFSDRRTGGSGYDNFSRGGYDDRRRDGGGYDNSYSRDNYRDAPRQASRYDDYNRRPAYSDNRYESDRGNDFERPQRSAGAYDRPPVRSDPVRSEDQREPAAATSAPVDEAPKTRPKLQLKPRSKPLEEIAAPAPVASRNIFGDAKPVDTARKEMEVEEKLKSLDVKEPATEPGRARTISSGSGSGSTSNRLRKESETDRRDENRPRRNDNFRDTRDADFGRRNDRPAPDRNFGENRDRRPGFGNDQRRPLHDERRRDDRGFQDRHSDRPVLRDRRDDRRDDRGPIRPRPDDDRRPDRRPELNRERDNNNGDYTVRNKYDALNDEDFDASTRYSVQD
ncbi:hypothetical protein RGQ29_031988 [Quercus rubra]|uniref:RRM domain-containing protein n=1 Tax=Quercus rubra TaxID=3512 RepID=A0AAN7I5B4_QUERU|nr:hypothetical protein RGQ29_031988 [Quercus rubra]